MTQLRVWLQMNEAAKEIIEKERFLTTSEAQNIVADILRRERDERPTSETVDLLVAHLKRLATQAKS